MIVPIQYVCPLDFVTNVYVRPYVHCHCIVARSCFDSEGRKKPYTSQKQTIRVFDSCQSFIEGEHRVAPTLASVTSGSAAGTLQT